ncbi:MAG TPA: methionyl-tRNA formyltransferase [Lacisediminihabitans sp.]|uniref:methionyl-tRNA formyltransferase n=1 Tax=Lacisediminihabitans sp. TaxID=2787631 RepID=UPI002EDA25E9
MPDLVIVFAGSPAAAVPGLSTLSASRHEVAAVVTREDSPTGRRRELTATPVAVAAEELALPVIKANRLAGPATEAITALRPDLGVIVAYGGLVREPLLSAPRLGWINLHFSLLPRWRGAAPVQRAIIAGDDITGASVFQLVPDLDAGDVYGTLTQAIRPDETAGELLDSLAVSGAQLLLGVVDAIADGTARAEAQSGDVTLAPKLELEDGRLRWTETAGEVLNRFRGVTPEPGAFTTVGGLRLKVVEARIAHDAAPLAPGRFSLADGRLLVGTASSPIELITVHPAGKRPMRAVDWWRGRPAGAAVAE